MVITLLKKYLYNTFCVVKAQLVWVAKSKIFFNVSWIIINLVHQGLLNLNWSEIYPGGGELECQEQQIIVVFHSL